MEKNLNNGISFYRYGELSTISLLEKLGYTNIQDVSQNPQYFDQDVDILAITPQGKKAKIEVKTDRPIAYTNNLFLEIIDNRLNPNKYKGWYFKTKCDILIYCAYKDRTITKYFIIDFNKLKQFVSKHRAELATKPKYDYYDEQKTLLKSISQGILCPVYWFKQEYPDGVRIETL